MAITGQIQSSLDIILDEYFYDFIRGNRTLNQLMPRIYEKIRFNFETDLIEGLNIDYYENKKLIESFKSNINKWAIARNYQQTREITNFVNAGDLTDIKIEEFLKSNKTRFNSNWLNNEARTMSQNIQMVNKFDTIPNDANMMYQTAGDELVRSSHRELNGLVLPKNSPQWAYLFPPPQISPWNCRCTVVPTYSKIPSTDTTLRIERMAKIDKVSVSKLKSKKHPRFSGEMFSTDSTYFENLPKKIRDLNVI